MRMRFILFALLCLAFTAASVHAGNGLTSTGEFLREERGARISAYGGAGSAISGDLFAVQSNPASIGGLRKFQAVFEHDRLIMDVTNNYVAFGGAWRELLSFGVWFAGIDYGSTLRTTVADPYGASSGSFTGSDIAAGLVLGGRVGYDRQFHWGVGVKNYRLTIDRHTAEGYAADLGLQWEGVSFGENHVRLGASLLNSGSSVTFMKEREDLPLSWRIGGFADGRMYRFGYEAALELLGGRNEASHLRVGVGVKPIEWLCLRIGSNTSRDFSQGFSTGFGVNWNDLNLDYAYLPYGDFGSRHKMSLAYSWGKPIGAEYGVGEPSSSRASAASRQPLQQAETMEAVPQPYVAARAQTPVEAPSRHVEAPATVQPQVSSAPQPAAVPVKTIEEKIEESMNRGNKLVSEGRYDAAAINYMNAAELSPNDARIAYNLATAQMLAGRYDDAARSFTKATTINPRDAESFMYLGVCHYNAGRTDLAHSAWRRTLELDPANETAKSYMILISN